MRNLKKRIKENGNSIKKLLNNQSGFSLTDLMASLPLTALVFIVMIIAIIHFGRSFEEVKYYVQLQTELFDAVETIRYGLTKDNVTDNEALMGVLAAREVTISSARTELTIKPLRTSIGLSDDDYKSKIWLTDQGEIKGWAKYGVKNTGTMTIFPSGNNKIDGINRFRVTNLEFYPKRVDSLTGDIVLLGVRVEAEVRYRQRQEGEALDDDLEKNVKTIDYETYILVGNAGS